MRRSKSALDLVPNSSHSTAPLKSIHVYEIIAGLPPDTAILAGGYCSTTTSTALITMEPTGSSILPRRTVIYCGACGFPPEYCEYGAASFRSAKCDPWLQSNHPELYEQLIESRGILSSSATPSNELDQSSSEPLHQEPTKPDKPWTTQERLTAFYQKYVPDKIADVPSLLQKYEGKEDKLFLALCKKYGPEPLDPYYSDSEDEGDEDSAAPVEGELGPQTEPPGAAAPKREGTKKSKDSSEGATRVLIQKVAQKKKRNLTIVSGMETVPGLKLKDASKAFAKRFAGSSSVKDNAKGEKEIIIQGDHMYDVAEMIVDKFGVPESCVWLDIEGDIVPLR